MARLRRSSCAAPGIARRGRGRGFEYRDPAGERIDDPEVLDRIAELAIPPAWKEVWICMDALGHLQATGMDAAGRKQYLYHERWRAHRDRLKFDTMLGFGEALPRLRRRVVRDLASAGPARLGVDDLNRERVLACSVRLLDLGFFRIGSEDYAERNESYGLTTVLRDHVTIVDSEVVFDFPAKSGQRRVQAITDNDALAVVAALRRRRSGSQLLAYREAGGWVEVRAEDVNAYIKQSSAWRLHRQGLPHVERDNPRGRRARGRRRARAHTPCCREREVAAPSRRWPPTSATLRRSAARPTSILA